MENINSTAPTGFVETLDAALTPKDQQAVMEALAYDAGVLLGTVINKWVDIEEIVQVHRILMGPAGTVALVAVCGRTLPPQMLGDGGKASSSPVPPQAHSTSRTDPAAPRG
jgi:hypothetical protein